MNIDDDKFYKKLLASFKNEAEDHLKVLTNGLFAFEKKSSNEEKEALLKEMFRAAHSLKGSARAVNFLEVESFCQMVEDIFASLKDKKIDFSKELVSSISDSLGILEQLIFEDNNQTFSLDEVLENLQQFLEAKTVETPQPIKKQPKDFPKANKKTRRETIRVSSKKIDNLMQLVEEMLIIKLGVKEKQREVKDILLQFDKCFEGFLQYREAAEMPDSLIDTFKGLIDRGRDLTSLWEQDNRVIGSMIDNVLESSKEILVEPIGTILDKFPKMVYDLAGSLGKEVSLEIIGDDIEVDKRVLESLNDPIIHILRNCIDHGIEPPEIRESKGKPREGKILVIASYGEGNKFKLNISDDGQGVDLDKVRKKASKDGMIAKKDLENIGEKELISCIFRAGFSTNEIVSEISGRGIGLDVLSENVEKLGGEISFSTERDKGTTVTIEMPLTMATFRGINVFAGDQEFILPTERVVRVVCLPISEIKSVEGSEVVAINQATYPYIHLGDLLKIPKQYEKEKDVIIVLIKASEIMIAVGIDSIRKEDEVYVKPLGYPLVRVKNIAAATIIEGGKIVPILHPFDLVKNASLRNVSSSQVGTKQQPTSLDTKSILLAEDSATTRMLLKNVLESSGFRVKIAVDGLDALKALRNDTFDLLLSDVEMPAMDGFKLTETVRGSEAWKDLPVVLCTSRGSKEDREHGIEVGANAYIDKSSFSSSALIDIIQQLIREK